MPARRMVNTSGGYVYSGEQELAFNKLREQDLNTWVSNVPVSTSSKRDF